MREKSTDDLKQELMGQADLDKYIKENEAYFSNEEISQTLSELLKERPTVKAELARRAGISEVYLHQVLSGRRTPSRDRLLCICIGLELDLEEIQQVLKQAGYAPIYPKSKRDAIITHGVLHRTPLTAINDKLFMENEKTLC